MVSWLRILVVIVGFYFPLFYHGLYKFRFQNRYFFFYGTDHLDIKSRDNIETENMSISRKTKTFIFGLMRQTKKVEYRCGNDFSNGQPGSYKFGFLEQKNLSSS